MEAKYKREKVERESEKMGAARVVMWGRGSLLGKIRR